MLLEKIRSGGAKGHDQIEPVIVKKSAKIIGEWTFLVFRPETGEDERGLIEVHRCRPLPIQFRSETLGIFVPGREIPSERVRQQHPLWLGGRHTQRGQEGSGRCHADTGETCHSRPAACSLSWSVRSRG